MSFRVLIVEDSEAIRLFIRRAIGLSGIQISGYFEACDGIEALDLLDREWVDIILTDINMPRLNGEEFVRRLAANGLTKSLPIIVVSNDSSPQRIATLHELGVRGYMIKPFAPEALRAQIEGALGIHYAD